MRCMSEHPCFSELLSWSLHLRATLKLRCDSCHHNLLTGKVRLCGGRGASTCFLGTFWLEQWPCTQQWLGLRHTTMKYSFYQLYWCVNVHSCTQFQIYILIRMKASLFATRWTGIWLHAQAYEVRASQLAQAWERVVLEYQLQNRVENFADVSTRCSGLLQAWRRPEHLVETSARFSTLFWSLCPCICWIWPLPWSCIPTKHSIVYTRCSN